MSSCNLTLRHAVRSSGNMDLFVLPIAIVCNILTELFGLKDLEISVSPIFKMKYFKGGFKIHISMYQWASFTIVKIGVLTMI